jgi:hypothetical protein
MSVNDSSRIVIDNTKVMLQSVASLTENSRGVIIIMTLSINNIEHNNALPLCCHYAECCILFRVMLSFILLNVIMLSVIRLSVSVLSVVVPSFGTI